MNGQTVTQEIKLSLLSLVQRNQAVRHNLAAFLGAASFGVVGLVAAASPVLASRPQLVSLLVGPKAQAETAVAGSSGPERVAAALPESPQDGAPRVASGVYVFGDNPEAGQPGHEYMVIQIEGDRVSGGFYQPASEFSCFSGRVTPDELTLQVQETYSSEVSTYSVPLYLNNRVAASEFVMPYENALGLQGTYRLDGVDEVSQLVLESCRADGTQDEVQ